MRNRLLAAGILLLGLAGCDAPTESRPALDAGTVASRKGLILELKLREDLQVRLDAQGQPLSARGADLSSFRAALARLGALAMRPLFTVPDVALEALTREATRAAGRAAPDLASWYRLELLPGTDPAAALAELRARPEVSQAYVAPVPAPPPVTPNFAAQQSNYFGPAPSGTENVYARSLAGGRGAGIRLIDLEYDWTFSHEDLGLSSSILITGQRNSVFGPHHGTAVLGVLVGRDNGLGIIGGAPNATIRVASPFYNGDYRPANAIAAASTIMDPGDVLLIEQHTDGPGSGNVDYVPLEWLGSVFDAIVVATQAGRIVIEAAGNGNQNLDAAMFLGRFNRSSWDSRAIIVGAGGSTNARLSFSTYGSRLDVQAHGTAVTTTGYGDLYGTTLNDQYTAGFGGTSSASAIVAAVATVVQGYLRHRSRPVLSPAGLSGLLQATGSPQTGTTSQRIGPKPNLRAALARIDAPVATPGLALRCSGVPGRDGNARVVADVTQNSPGSTLTLERLSGTSWSVIKTWPDAPSGVHTYNTGFPSSTFRARAILSGVASAYTAQMAKSC